MDVWNSNALFISCVCRPVCTYSTFVPNKSMYKVKILKKREMQEGIFQTYYIILCRLCLTAADDLSAGFCNIYKYSGNVSGDKSEK